MKKHKKKKPEHVHSSIIHAQGIYAIRRCKGQHKRNCTYYNALNNKCMNKGCSKVYCQTARGCQCYKKIVKPLNKSDDLSEYDENYIQIPRKSGIHESDMTGSAISRDVGTAMHTTYLHSNDTRRHRARCVYFRKQGKYCLYYYAICRGSGKCKEYKEKA